MNKVTIAGDASPREILEGLAGWFNVDDDEASLTHKQQLWDVLSALRGPDNNDAGLKSDMTAVIRDLALPGRSLSRGIAGLAMTVPGTTAGIRAALAERRGEWVRNGKPLPWHFTGHVERAVDALDAMGLTGETPTSPVADDGKSAEPAA